MELSRKQVKKVFNLERLNRILEGTTTCVETEPKTNEDGLEEQTVIISFKWVRRGNEECRFSDVLQQLEESHENEAVRMVHCGGRAYGQSLRVRQMVGGEALERRSVEVIPERIEVIPNDSRIRVAGWIPNTCEGIASIEEAYHQLQLMHQSEEARARFYGIPYHPLLEPIAPREETHRIMDAEPSEEVRGIWDRIHGLPNVMTRGEDICVENARMAESPSTTERIRRLFGGYDLRAGRAGIRREAEDGHN